MAAYGDGRRCGTKEKNRLSAAGARSVPAQRRLCSLLLLPSSPHIVEFVQIMGFPRLLVWTAWAALAGLLAQRLVQDGREPLHCDTTYLWQGYEEELAGEGGAYRLVRFADKDAKRAAGA